MIKKMICMAALMTSLVSCSSTKDKVVEDNLPVEIKAECEKIPPQKGKNSYVPKSNIYRMNGDYHLNVPISIDSDGVVISYPDPRDLRLDMLPISLVEGYWLDLRGVGENTVFLTYTYSEYMALDTAPSIEELKSHIIPEAKVIEVITVPLRLWEAAKDTTSVNDIIRQGLPQCEVKYQAE